MRLWLWMLIASVGVGSSHAYAERNRADQATLATPIGITLQPIVVAPAANPANAGNAANAAATPAPARNTAGFIFYADAKGMALYTSDNDLTAGRSTCVGECAATWRPAAATAQAKPFGDWSIVHRDDGGKQWALKGKPLYTFSGETDIGGKKGDGVDGSWHVATFQPADGLRAPFGIALRDVPDGGGQVLVDGGGRTLYRFSGNVKNDGQGCDARACTTTWEPLKASQLAQPTGEFSIVGRADGNLQWAYRGEPLYRYSGDLLPGRARGIGVDKRWQVARVVDYFTPANIVMGERSRRGAMWTTRDGKAIYLRNQFRGSLNRTPTVGRNIGVKLCDDECLKTWRPVPAPADAMSSGYWDVIERADGSRQWAYKGFALYTYQGDKKPGDTSGDLVAIMIMGNDVKNVPPGLFDADSAALFWLVATP